MSLVENQLELIRWALGAQVAPHPRIRIGEDRAARVLIALATYADVSTRVAWPSAQTIADDIGLPAGSGRRTVRDALTVLESSGLIERTAHSGRSTAWHLLAGIPATESPSEPVDNTDDTAGNPATSTPVDNSPDVAGELAGDMAGRPAGTPATNKNRNKNNPPTPHRGAGGDHKNEPNARRALATIIGSRRLPFTIDELLAIAYTHTTGDPWDGYLTISAATTDAFDDARDPRAVLLKRIHDRGLHTHQVRAA
ncbi:helix-turn-helix domain-containing protein [Microbacterium hominis]|uniref:helix-turn-helix domain-containing protein n=1 Tax=Microbacterium hominis TaxID=162426 RepID=UPI0007689214|nr:helix-turn-helix domain-containing protein [Microbacterium hominis]KXC05763.1 hypothetical protein MhomT_09180 [Microbacterium hominis]